MAWLSRYCAILTLGCIAITAAADPKPDYLALAVEVHQHFDRHILAAWFPHCVDTVHGGFKSQFTRDWKPLEKQDRFLVFQARMTWVASQVAMNRPELREQYLKYARHGVAMLSRMWDAEHGGLYWAMDESATSPVQGDQKHAYGISFGIYAAAAAYEATHDPAALELSVKTFHWFDQHAHDDTNGGYHEVLTREGRPVLPANSGQVLKNRSPFPNRVSGYKSMNSHIHLLEAITQLYRVKKDDAARRRLEELFLIVRDKVAVDPGCLNLYFTPQWRAVPDHDSFGHDIETAFLLIEAAEALEKGHDAATLATARRLVDHALDLGYDSARGGFYDKGFAFDPAFDTSKVWWTQAEGLNALLLMHTRFGHETERYWKCFLQTWSFVNQHIADREYGGWFNTVRADGHVERADKAQNWKAAYHDGRALLNIERMLRAASASRQ